MYSRYSDRPQKPVRLPEHYSGVAFSSREAGESARFFEVAKPSPPVPNEPPVHEKSCKNEQTCDENPAARPLIPLPPHRAHPVGSPDFDRLLLLGLMLLLWGNERDGDMILWLGLLLL
ncbi:MAG: hypothetical protein IJW29_01480 [Clostridia bacterium]|nr:hypothetical protein [Clostridia bacterium]